MTQITLIFLNPFYLCHQRLRDKLLDELIYRLQ